MGDNGTRSSRLYKHSLHASVAFSAFVLILGAGGAQAQSANDGQVKALQAQIDQLQHAVNQMKSQQAQTAADAKAARKQANEAQAEAAHAEVTAGQMPTKAPGWGDCGGHSFLERKPGAPLTIYTCGGEMTAYGNIDVSFDDTAKNYGRTLQLNGATSPIGNFGWMPAISTNLSYLGVRGFQHVSDYPFNFVYQLEVGFEVSATPGLKVSGSAQSDQVNGALFNRNTYIGLASADWGALKIGKTDAPYKTSTAEFNPFVGMIGDYAVIMGNTGGDNRVEFGTRLDHAVWYESPVVSGFQFNALFAPGQNRAYDTSDLSAGESDCAGNDTPESGGNIPSACNDGAFSNAASANLSYRAGGFYATVAYEWHDNVNRQSDITSIYGAGSVSAMPASGQVLFAQDVADEDAAKVGALYRFETGTTIGGIFESLHRYVPQDLEFQNERTRYGTWLFASQQLTAVDSLHFG
jgi:predicted porin/cell division protein FtsB